MFLGRIAGPAEVQPVNGPRSPEAGRSRPTSAPRLRSGGFLFLQNSGLLDRPVFYFLRIQGGGRGSRKRTDFGLHRRCRGRGTKSEKTFFSDLQTDETTPTKFHTFHTLKRAEGLGKRLQMLHPKKGHRSPQDGPKRTEGGNGSGWRGTGQDTPALGSSSKTCRP